VGRESSLSQNLFADGCDKEAVLSLILPVAPFGQGTMADSPCRVQVQAMPRARVGPQKSCTLASSAVGGGAAGAGKSEMTTSTSGKASPSSPSESEKEGH